MRIRPGMGKPCILNLKQVDLRVANAVCALGATAERICSDIRHLANLKELEEPFEKSQIVRQLYQHGQVFLLTTEPGKLCHGLQGERLLRD